MVLFHGLSATDGSLDAWPHFIAAVISHGFVGVSFFFVLSGFILAYSYSGQLRLPQDQRDFWWARAARILPAYFLAFLIFSPFAVYSVMISFNPLSSAINSLAIASFQLTLTQAWIPKAAVAWNGPAWSLSVEAFFYLLFPFILPKLESMSARAIALVAISAYAASQIFALMIWQIGPYKVALKINNALGFGPLTHDHPDYGSLFYMYFPILRVPEFIFGAAIGLIFVRAPPIARGWHNTSIFIGIVGLVVGFQLLDGMVPGLSNGIFMPFLGLVLFGLARSKSRIWNNAAFVRLGDASYSIYLLHIPIFSWLNAIDRHLFHLYGNNFKTFFILYLLSVIGASLVSLQYVEKPSCLLIRRQFSSGRVLALKKTSRGVW